MCPIDLLTGTIGSTVRMPYVPNSMVMDRQGTSLYFGSARELMVYSTTSNTLTKQDTNVPGVVLAVSPNNSQVLINDQVRQLFYLYNASAGSFTTFGGLGNAAAWTPDSKTLYITDNAALNNGTTITGHTDTLYVYSRALGGAPTRFRRARCQPVPFRRQRWRPMSQFPPHCKRRHSPFPASAPICVERRPWRIPGARSAR